MNQNKLKLLWIAFFIAFAAVSCWATAESLNLLLSSWPAVFCWIVTIGFFIVASFGSKLIVDSLNQNVYSEHRTGKLIGGILIMLVFWLICSMPTNTHTFFYRTLIEKEFTEDVTTTKSYLAQIENDQLNAKKYKDACKELDNAVKMKLGELKAEINNAQNPGFGPNAKRIFNDFAELLQVSSIEPLSLGANSNTPAGRERLYNSYSEKIYNLRDARKEVLLNQFFDEKQSEQRKKDAKLARKNIDVVKESVASGALSLFKPVDVREASDKITEGYVVVKTNRDFVTFNTNSDKERYTSDKLSNRIERLLSVFDVWMDFVQGKTQTGKFIFWIIISMLVDIAAFIFFDLAFKKEDF